MILDIDFIQFNTILRGLRLAQKSLAGIHDEQHNVRMFADVHNDLVMQQIKAPVNGLRRNLPALVVPFSLSLLTGVCTEVKNETT